MPSTNHEIDGSLHPAFAGVAERLKAQLKEEAGGAAVCIYHRGEPVVDLWGGARDAQGNPWRQDTMAPSFSTTKGVASTLLHIMVDRGLIDYRDRVAKHWPEFGQAGKERITVRHVMSHQAGLYHIRQMIDSADRMVDWPHMIEAIERSEPVHAPGERTAYHGLTYGYLTGELLQRITGRSFSQLVQDELVDALGLDGMQVGADDAALARTAELLFPNKSFLQRALPHPAMQFAFDLYRPGLELGARMFGVQLDVRSMFDSLAPSGIMDFDFASQRVLRATIPAANGLFTARSLARMYAALANGGELDGTRLFSERTHERATRLEPHSGNFAVIPVDMGWRLGYHGVWTTQGQPRNAFGHFGFGGSGAWCDPSRELSVALVLNSGLGTPFGDSRIARVSAAALRCADAIAPRPRGSARRGWIRRAVGRRRPSAAPQPKRADVGA